MCIQCGKFGYKQDFEVIEVLIFGFLLILICEDSFKNKVRIDIFFYLLLGDGEFIFCFCCKEGYFVVDYICEGEV